MKRILLIEDDELLMTLYRDLLKTLNEEVETVTDGKKAFEKISTGSYDLIILDVMLPEMNALEILKKLKEVNPVKLSQKIVIMSNLADEKMENEIRNFGFPILVKSQMNPDEFIAKIKTLLI